MLAPPPLSHFAPPRHPPPHPTSPQAEVKPDLTTACDYVRAGPHKGCYRLKPEWRSTASVQPDPNDGVA